MLRLEKSLSKLPQTLLPEQSRNRHYLTNKTFNTPVGITSAPSVLGRSRYALDLTIAYGTLLTFRSSGRWPTYRGAQVTPPLFVHWEQCDFSDPQTGTPTIDYWSCFRRNLISPPPIVSHNSLCRSCLVAVSRAVMRRLSPQITNTRS